MRLWVLFLASTLTTEVSLSYLQHTRLLMGIGIAGFFVPMTAISLSQLKPHQIAAGTGLTNFLRNMGGSVGTAVGSSMWQNNAAAHHVHLVDSLPADAPAFVEITTKLGQLGLSEGAQLQFLDQLVSAQAYVLSTNQLMLFAAVVMLSLVPLVWFAKPPFPSGGVGH